MDRSCSPSWPRILAALLGIASVNAGASGFRVPEASVAGIGTSNALVANSEEPGALPYNPAAESFHAGSEISAGLLLIAHDVAVTPAGSARQVDSQHDNPAYLPTFLLAYRAAGDWGMVLNVNVPYGLKTEWPPNTFPVLSTPLTAAAHPAESRIETINVNPNVTYRIAENTSIAVGVDYYRLRDVRLDTQVVTIEGDGSEIGWNAAVMYVVSPWSFGVSYRSAVTVGVDGTLTTPASSADINADVSLPWILQLGARYSMNQQLGIELDFERTGWKEFDEIAIHSAASGSTLIRSRNAWNDANAYRLGITYELNSHDQLRAGYSRDFTGQGDEHFSARVSDADRQLFSLGLKHAFPERWSVEGGYMYVKFDDRSYASSVPFGTYGADPNGTSAYNGKYESSAHVFGLGVSKQF